MSTHPNNPFIRGYNDLFVQRVLAVLYEKDRPLTYPALHASQSHLRDDQVERHSCIFTDDFALITEGQEVSDELVTQCRHHGTVQRLIYAVMAGNARERRHVGDTYSDEAAREVVHRLRFETGFYSRCWEISSAHLTEGAFRYLGDLADIATPSGFLFVAFRIPYCPAVGVKLISTPWTDAHLRDVDGRTAATLLHEHSRKGVPQSLIEVLHLAGQADIRMLAFDDYASVLEGLKLYED